MKPQWADAPEWAKFLARDGDGWWWFETEPSWNPRFKCWGAPQRGQIKLAVRIEDGSDSMECRP